MQPCICQYNKNILLKISWYCLTLAADVWAYFDVKKIEYFCQYFLIVKFIQGDIFITGSIVRCKTFYCLRHHFYSSIKHHKRQLVSRVTVIYGMGSNISSTCFVRQPYLSLHFVSSSLKKPERTKRSEITSVPCTSKNFIVRCVWVP